MRIIDPEELAHSDSRSVESIARAREFTVAVAAGELSGCGLAAALHADWVIAAGDAVLDFDAALPAAWSGAIWRIGSGALRFFLLDEHRIVAASALALGLIDAVVPAATDPLEWTRDWLAGRSAVALDSAAALIRQNGGDVLERAEFARLFATGEPREGLNAFLGKRRPRFAP